MLDLHKWYLDCVSDNGTAFIGYAATLRVFAYRLRYSAYLLSSSETAHEHRTWSDATLPQTHSGVIEWSCPRLSVQGMWSARSTDQNRVLYQSKHGSVEWHCRQPASDVSVQIDGRNVRGRGYAEELRMSVAPWKLPIDELVWGRFVGEHNSIVWIQWRGPRPLLLVIDNGRVCENGKIDNLSIATDRGRLDLHDPRTLRHATLTDRLKDVPLVGSRLSKRFGATIEHKLLRRATFFCADGSTDSGWAIHETVQW